MPTWSSNLAASRGVRDGAPNIEGLRQKDNVEATENVLASVAPNTHVVTTSSSSVYGRASLSDGGLVERLLGFVPTTDLHAVLERMVEAALLPALVS